MDVQFAKKDLDRLETDKGFTAGYPADVVRAYRRRVATIRDAVDERAFYAMKSLHYEKLKGKRSHERSMRLNQQWRLIIELKKVTPTKIVVIVDISDHYK